MYNNEEDRLYGGAIQAQLTIPDRFFLPSADFEPAYMALHRSGELKRRAEAALERLHDCHVCPRDCGVDRMADKTAACKIGRYAQVSSYFPHQGEEDCLRGWRGSGTIFFSMCNLRCVFCFHPDTLIATDSGLRRIANLYDDAHSERPWHNGTIRTPVAGAQVITRHGRLAPIAKAFKHPFSGHLIRLKPRNLPLLLLTPNHRVFVASNAGGRHPIKIPAGQIRPQHLLITPQGPVPLESIDRIAYDGPVYNLDVDDPDHSYLAPFVAVSNCQNYDISQAGRGRETDAERLAVMMLELQARGCHNINFVTPEHVVPQILEALPLAVEHGLRLPLVYNTSAYDSMDSLELLDGIVDIYMPDFKMWDDRLSLRYLIAKDYPEAARRAIKEMHRQVGPLKFDEHGVAKRGVLLRHLVMPGDIAQTVAIMRYLADEISRDTYVNVMAQYYPAGKVTAQKFEEINRRITRGEMADAIRAAKDAGLWRLDERIPRGPNRLWKRHPADQKVIN